MAECVPGDKDLICRLHHFTLDKASKEDVEDVLGWLKARFIVIVVIFICMCCRWTQTYRKMSSLAGKPMASNGIRCVVGYGTGCCLGRATDGSDGRGRWDGVYD